MLKRLATVFVIVPIGLIVITLAVANRQPVTLVVPPQIGDTFFLSLTVPLFVLVFASLLVGMFLGGFVTWVRQGKYRKQARESRSEVVKQAFEVQKQKNRADELAQQNAEQAPVAGKAIGLLASSKAA